MLWKRLRKGVLVVIILFIFVLSFLYPVVTSTASDPSLIEVLDYLGFSNVNETNVETFALGTYNITLYAEFSEICNENELSCYDANTTLFNVVFTGHEGGSGYLSTPISKSFTARFQFGLSVLWPDGEGGGPRCFIETWRNSDGEKHTKVFEDLDDPGMLFVGFRDMHGAGDEKYNDVILSLEPIEFLWDLNGDGKFDMRDIGIIVKAFGTKEGDADWNPDADLTGSQGQPDGKVDIRDVALAAKYFGEEFPAAAFEYSPLCPVVNETVTFDASMSNDPDGSILNYRWDFGDGKVKTTNEPVTTHIYRAANSIVNCTVSLTVTDDGCLTNSTSAIVPVTNPAILHVSLPIGEDRTGISDPDPWLSECWLLNITDANGRFVVKVEDVSGCIPSYDTHLAVALNDAAYNNLVELTVNNITLMKNDFKPGILRPYHLRDWPAGDVYPTWHNDTLVNLGTICPKKHKNATVTLTLSNVTGAKLHFDAYGSKESCPIPPVKKCYITYNPLSEDSTVIFSPPPTCHLMINASAGGTTDPIPGTYVFDCKSSVSVTAIPDSCYQFDNWELDGIDVGSANPYTVLIDGDHTLHAIFEYSATPLSVSIDPLSASVFIGESVVFTSRVDGGIPPYNYQWYLNDDLVSGADGSSWTFTPMLTGTYYVHLEVTDLCNGTVRSETARIGVITMPVGGHSISLPKTFSSILSFYYAMLLAIFTVGLGRIRKRIDFS